jgi:predicted Co/Zn/Cd cation transporter (cation efflux family)
MEIVCMNILLCLRQYGLENSIKESAMKGRHEIYIIYAVQHTLMLVDICVVYM